jgi:transmembrane sensor
VAGQSARAQAEKVAIAPVAREEVTRRLAWQSGQLVFDRQPLSQVVEEFNRYNRRQVRILSAGLDSLELTGNFKATDLASFVAAVKSAADVEVERSGDAVVIRSR